jgi:hypothetical protein
MGQAPQEYSVDEHFAGKAPAVRALYDRLLATVRKLGSVHEEAKKTCIHLVRSSALAGVEVRKNYLLVNIKTDSAIASPRIEKTEQISARRFHHKLKLSVLGDIDKELQNWLKSAYELSA